MIVLIDLMDKMKILRGIFHRLLFSFIDFFPNRLFSSNKQLYKLIQQILMNGRPSVSNATAQFNWEERTTPFGDQSPGANSLDTLGSATERKKTQQMIKTYFTVGIVLVFVFFKHSIHL